MPAPLIWLGVACASLYVGNKANTRHLKRKGVISAMPGDSSQKVPARNGSIVRCGIYGVLDHTGIWVDGNIYELSGEGLVRCVSPHRFLGGRSGNNIYVACDTQNIPLYDLPAVDRLKRSLYELKNYHLVKENCHRFVAESLSGHDEDITSFSDLNSFLFSFFNASIHWNLCQIN